MLRKASKQLKNPKVWQRFTKAYCIIGVASNVAMAGYLEIYVFHLANTETKKELLSCTSFIWLINNLNYMVMSSIFVIFACKLNHSLTDHIRKMK